MKALNDERKAKILKALDEIAKRGDVCKELADAGKAMLNKTTPTLQVFVSSGFTFDGKPFGGAAPLGGDWLVIADYWTDTYETTLSSDGRNLQHILAHELDHHKNRHHNGHGTPSEDLYNTPNSKSCSGL
jgi:hypothetical protein